MKAGMLAVASAVQMAASSVGKSADRTVEEMAGMWDVTRAVCLAVHLADMKVVMKAEQSAGASAVQMAA